MLPIKPPLTIEEMIAHLRDDHKFTIDDENRAKKYLQTTGYYRLSGYAIPFYTDSTRSTAINGANFEDIIDIYIFDRKLRILIIEALERIEIALRAAIIDKLALLHKDPFFYSNPNNFDRDKQGALQNFLTSLNMDIEARKDIELFNKSFFEKNKDAAYPYVWIAFQNLSFGGIVTFLNKICNERQVIEVAAVFNFEKDIKRFKSLLVALNNLRNVCAHHSRCWNKEYNLLPSPDGIVQKIERFINFNEPMLFGESDYKLLYRFHSKLKHLDGHDEVAVEKLVESILTHRKLKANFLQLTTNTRLEKIDIDASQLEILYKFAELNPNIAGEQKRLIKQFNLIPEEIKNSRLLSAHNIKRINSLLNNEEFKKIFFLDNKSIPALNKLNKYLLSSNVENSSYVYANKVPMVRKYSKNRIEVSSRLYARLEIIWDFLKIISPNSTWSNRLFALMKDYNLIENKEEHTHLINISQENMGFVPDWYQEPFWGIEEAIYSKFLKTN